MMNDDRYDSRAVSALHSSHGVNQRGPMEPASPWRRGSNEAESFLDRARDLVSWRSVLGVLDRSLATSPGPTSTR